MFDKVLIANRGEIACRIIKTCRKLGISTVAVYAKAEGTPLHAELADEAFALPESATPAGSYLDAEAIAGIAAESGANAIHPGYGFLSESPVFADRCADRGIVFVGPRPDVARLMADKWEARKQMASLGVPVLPGASVDAGDEGSTKTALEAVGLPLMVKATDGGGGIGMQAVESEARLQRALRRASSSALRAFGSAEVYIEKLVSPARHIEVQVIADQLGNVRHLWERECSAQRRHQKVIEEAPAPCLPEGLRESLAEMAVRAARETGYVGAGTFEFIVDDTGSAYFLEANTRLQVEHGVTEMITGVDLVEQQLLAAAGLPLSVDGNAAVRGHAVECRIYAEDPKTFMPSPGTLDTFDLPEMADLRIDGGYRKGDAVTPFFDPLLAKVIAWGESRDDALRLMEKALSATEVSGVSTNISTLRAALHHADFAAGRYSTGLIESLS